MVGFDDNAFRINEINDAIAFGDYYCAGISAAIASIPVPTYGDSARRSGTD
jgi:hypothetical protein